MSGHVLNRCQDTGVARAIPTVVLATSECKPAPPAVRRGVVAIVGRFLLNAWAEKANTSEQTQHTQTPRSLTLRRCKRPTLPSRTFLRSRRSVEGGRAKPCFV